MIKLGIIGSNFVSDWLCDSIDRTGGIVNHAVYSRTTEKGTAFAEKHNIPTVYTDMEDFLSSDIDAVYIASPNAFHFPQAMAALSHGKHVLCEKPIALDSRELAQMIDTARRNNVILLEAMRTAFDPALSAVSGCLDRLGAIRYARFEFCQYSSRYDKFKSGEVLNAFNPKLGNAALMDIGVYAVHACVKVFGKPDMDHVWAQSVKLVNGFEGMGNILLPYGSFTAEVLYSKITESIQPSVIIGENGSVTIDKLSMPQNVVLHMRGQEPEALTFEKKTCNMEFETAEFVRLIRGGEVNHSHMIHSVNALAVMDKARELTDTKFE